MLCFPNAKINIGLYITGKRPDGYHDIETLFYPVPLCDALEIIPAAGKKESMQLYGLPVAGDYAQNLVWKAYLLLQKDFPDRVQPIRIHLYKNIPMGAGLGGGSSDAAFMLRMLNDYFHLHLHAEQLAAYALALGSDCPVFLENKPRYARGRGEMLSATDIDLSGYGIQLICPEIHVSTAEAYRAVRPRKASFDLRLAGTLSPGEWETHIQNDFEEPVFRLHPELAEIKRQLYDRGALYAGMSGSGATVFGIFKKGEKAVIRAGTAFREFYF